MGRREDIKSCMFQSLQYTVSLSIRTTANCNAFISNFIPNFSLLSKISYTQTNMTIHTLIYSSHPLNVSPSQYHIFVLYNPLRSISTAHMRAGVGPSTVMQKSFPWTQSQKKRTLPPSPRIYHCQQLLSSCERSGLEVIYLITLLLGVTRAVTLESSII